MKLLADMARTVTDKEHRCEECQRRPAVVIFDRKLVCPVCYRTLEDRLVRHG